MKSSTELQGKAVVLSRRNKCAILRMSNGENKFNLDFIRDLHEALDLVESCSEVEALVTIGSDRFFSNGLDLAFIAQSDEDTRADFVQKYKTLMARFLTFPLLTVAAINGHAFAAGGLLAMAHDYRLMREDKGWICLNEVHLRLRFPPGICEMVTAKLTNRRSLFDFLALGKRFSGPAALSGHLVDGVCKHDELLNKAVSLAEKTIGSNPFDRATLRTMKMDLYKSAVSELTRDYSLEELQLLSPNSKL